MAYEIPVLNETFVAGGSIAQFKFLRLSADNTVVLSASLAGYRSIKIR